MSGEMLVTGPAEPGAKQDTRPYEMTPYSHAWWEGSPYTSFKDFMENMNRNDAGRYRTSACTAMVDAGVAVYRRWEAEAEYNGGSAALDSDVEGLVRAVLCEVNVKPEVA